MNSRLFWPIVMCVTVLPLSSLVLAQNSMPPAAVPGAGAVSIRNSVNGTTIWDDVRRVGRMTKDVRVTQEGEDFILYADDVTYNEALQQAVAVGNIRVETRDSTIRGAKIFADFNKKILTLTGKVSMSSYGEKDGILAGRKGRRADSNRKPSKMVCDRIDWDYEERQATVTGNIRLNQNKNSGTCDLIFFDERRNAARLEGNVRFRDEKGRLITTSELTVYMDTDKVQTPRGTSIFIPRTNQASPTARPVRQPAVKFEPEASITDEQLRAFAITPPPAPTPRQEVSPASEDAVETPATGSPVE